MELDKEQTPKNIFDAAETLTRLRADMQSFIDPKTGNGRGFDAELTGSKRLDTLTVDTPDKAMALLEATIDANYDPVTSTNPVPKEVSSVTWATALSGVTENELIGDVFRGNPDDNSALWIEKIKTMIADNTIPGYPQERPVHAVGHYSNDPSTPDSDVYWLAQLRGMVLESVKLAAKRSLDVDTDRGFHGADDATGYIETEETQNPEGTTRSTKIGRRGMRGLLRR